MQSGGLRRSNTPATKSIFSHSSASTWTVFDLWLMFYLFFSVLFTWDSTFFRGLTWMRKSCGAKEIRSRTFCVLSIYLFSMRRSRRANLCAEKKRAFIDIIKDSHRKCAAIVFLTTHTGDVVSITYWPKFAPRKKSAAIYVEIIIIIDKTTISADDLGLVIISCALRLKESCEWLSSSHGQEMFSSFLLHLRCSFSYFISHSGCLMGGGGGMLFIINLGQTAPCRHSIKVHVATSWFRGRFLLHGESLEKILCCFWRRDF